MCTKLSLIKIDEDELVTPYFNQERLDLFSIFLVSTEIKSGTVQVI